jgi:hypothetical protein
VLHLPSQHITLPREEAWFEVLLVKTSTVKEVQGGMSAIVGALLDTFFDVHGHNMRSSGFQLKLHDNTELRVFATLDVFIADEAALHSAYACKGSAGLKPCLLCQNVFNARTARDIVDRDPTGFAQSHTCVDASKLVAHTPATITAIVNRLSAAADTLTLKDLAEVQTRLGWNWLPEGLLMQPRWKELADPTRVAWYDWMHVWLVNGVFNSHMGLMMKSLKPCGITYPMLDTYVKMFKWPGFVGSSAGKNVFSPKRAKSSWEEGSLKATASECLSLVPVVGNYMQALMENTQSDTVRQHAAAFLLLVMVIELLQRTARGNVDPDVLRAAIVAHLQAFRNLFGVDAMPPKVHYCLHFPEFLRRLGYLPNCFVLERKHKLPKRFGNQVLNTSGAWEGSVLRDVSCHHVWKLTDGTHLFGVGACLIDPSPPKKTMLKMLQQEFGARDDPQFATARCARINKWERCSVNDVVLARVGDADIVGQVSFHASANLDGEVNCFTGLRRWELLEEGARSAKYRMDTDRPLIIMTDEITCALVWGGDSTVVSILKPSRI